MKNNSKASFELNDAIYDFMNKFFNKFEVFYQNEIMLLKSKIDQYEKQIKTLNKIQNKDRKEEEPNKYESLIEIDQSIKDFLSNRISVTNNKERVKEEKFSGVDFMLNELYGYLNGQGIFKFTFLIFDIQII